MSEKTETAGEGGREEPRHGAIFLVGSSRSGTNLLRAMLNKHSRIWLAGETHYFDDLRPRLGAGATTPLDETQRAEAERYFLALAHRPYGYGGDPDESALDPAALRELAGELGGSGDAYLEAYCILQARRRDKPVWAEKTPRHVFRIDEIVAAFPDARVVCLIRDPRAVVASNRDWHRAGSAEGAFADARAADRERTKRSYNIVLTSLLWRGAVRSAQAAYRNYGPDRIRLLSFENLVASPTLELPSLCRWLDLDYEPEMLEIPVVNSSYDAGGATGVSAEPIDRWRSKLSDREISIVQRCCGSLMEELGYKQLPAHASPVQLAWAGASLVPATVRAGFANRARLGRATEYVRRRAAAAFSR